MTACRKCGDPLPAQSGPGRPRTMCRTCSPPKRARPTLTVVTDLPVADEVEPPESIVEAVERELAAAGRRWTSAGMAASMLARRMVDAVDEPGTALAQLARQLSATMGEALADADLAAADDLDRLLSDG